jgi:lauroyl/myristoyl acyltransferase
MGVRLLEIVASSLPRKAALHLGAALGETARILGVRRSTVAANLRYVGMEGFDDAHCRTSIGIWGSTSSTPSDCG